MQHSTDITSLNLESALMARTWILPFLFASFVLNCYGDRDARKIHVVYMGHLPKSDVSTESVHHNMLARALGSILLAKESLLHSYKRSFNGFVARLSKDEVAKIKDMEGVVSVLPNTKLKLHTTRSWDFMGLTQSHVGGSYQGDVVVGIIDTGIWPESKSFNDEGLDAPPAKWKGVCQNENNFTCNNKIIGARFYNIDNSYTGSDIKSPRDSEGHGTHTASTAAGQAVAGVSYYGLGEGVARGAVPKARIAVYKVCWSNGCSSADMLAAFDDAIADGVDILSVSIGAFGPYKYFQDTIAIGSFHAMKNGILTSNSAGNDGPYPKTISNYSPWSLTVAASSTDRKFITQLVLGNGQTIIGIAMNSFQLNGTSFPLIWGSDAANSSAGSNFRMAGICSAGRLNSMKVAGKIVFCNDIKDASGVLMAKGVGTIMIDNYNLYPDVAFSFPIPATVVTKENGQRILTYIQSTKNPVATILVGEEVNDVMAPTVVSFSSRGPSKVSPDILKPDLTAPGVDIIAAWSPISSPSLYSGDSRNTNYNIVSGTSMSCPHVTGAAAYVKSVHPNWSPAAIKSSLMTTASIMNPRKNEDAEFSYGSGHINPLKAINPGLVFDASETDYVDFLCKQGYDTGTLRLVTGDSSVCSSTKPGRGWDLNYPSLALAIEDNQPIMGTFTRTVTNVGFSNSTYHSSVYLPPTLTIKVEPSVLEFSAVGEKKSFTVTVLGPKIAMELIISGAILWYDSVHVVRSPIVVYTVLPPDSSYSSFSVGMMKPSMLYR